MLALATFLFAGCKKNTECKATIKVVDPAGAAVAGASVNLTYGDVTDIQITDGSGKTYHTFELQAILNIKATHNNFPADTATGTIRLEPGENVEKTVSF